MNYSLNVVFQLQSQECGFPTPESKRTYIKPQSKNCSNAQSDPIPPSPSPYPFFLSKRKGQGSFSINTNVIKSFGITNFRLTLFNEIGIFVLNQYLYMYIFNNGFFVCYVVLCLKNSFQLYE